MSTPSQFPVTDARLAQTPVRNQGPRPTCAVFAATGAHEWMCGDQPDLSEEFALWAAKRRDGLPGEATTVQAALAGVSDDGQPDTPAWRYGQPRFPAPPPAAALDPARRRRAAGWQRLPAMTVATIADAVADGNAVVLSLGFVAAAWHDAFTDGYVHAPAGAPTLGGHAVLAVGVQVTGTRTTVVMKNSWGPGWGDGGYGYLDDGYVRDFGWVAHTLDPTAAVAA